MFAGSITKLLTAVAALRLVGAGQLTLDARANDHLTNLRVASDDVTVLHLLTHTSGVSSDFEHFADEVPPPESLLGREVRVDSTPGAGWAYSNGGYTVLGEIIATVTGSTVDRAITDLVLTPLGMSSSAFARSWPDTIGPGYAVEDHQLVEVPRKVASVLAPGGLITTAGDLGRFVMGWQGLLPRQLAAAAIQPATSVNDGQGLGWALGRVRGERTAGHPGGVLGFSSSLLWLPDHGVARIVLTNRAIQPQALAESLIRSELRRA